MLGVSGIGPVKEDNALRWIDLYGLGQLLGNDRCHEKYRWLG
jgi:hypothetical protein